MHKVLVVDADPNVCAQLKESLELVGCMVEQTAVGKESLDLLSLGIEVLITEVHLPDMPAWELVPQVHAFDPRLPVIAITDDDSWETSRKMRTKGEGLFYYALKPLDLREMQKVVDCAIRWRQRLQASYR